MGHNIFGGLLYAILISTIIGIVWGKYTYEPALKGWIAPYMTISTFHEAVQRCQSDGAVLMSPLRKELLDKMRSLMGSRNRYYIGVESSIHPALFESLEGVLLDDMPVSDICEEIDSQKGHCLSMTYDRISNVPCSSRLPYMCYKEDTYERWLTECGTLDKGYKLIKNTNHCYKFHSEAKTWKEAYFTCRAEEAYLAIADDEKEAQEIVNLFSYKSHYVYVGVHYWAYGSWQSVLGTPIQNIYHKWEENTHAKNKIVALIHPTTRQLQASEGFVKNYFICEKDPIKIKFSFNL